MSKERKALGRGLSALISQTGTMEFEPAKPYNHTPSPHTIYNININKISPNRNQPRKIFAEGEIKELAASITEHGVIQPILVKELNDGFYELIAGERRWQASKRAGLAEIPAIIKEASEIKSFEYAMIENIQRQDLNPIEEALAYQKLIEAYEYTHDQLAKKLSKSRSHISNALRVLNLPSNIKTLIEENKLSFGHARALINSDNPLEIANQVIEKNLSVRETEQLVKGEKHTKNSPLNKLKAKGEKLSLAQVENNEDIMAIEQMLSDSLRLQVRIASTESGGQLRIDFRSLEDLDNLIQILGAKGLNF